MEEPLRNFFPPMQHQGIFSIPPLRNCESVRSVFIRGKVLTFLSNAAALVLLSADSTTAGRCQSKYPDNFFLCHAITSNTLYPERDQFLHHQRHTGGNGIYSIKHISVVTLLF